MNNVISTRVSVFRNIKDFKFENKLTQDQKQQIIKMVESALKNKMSYLNINGADAKVIKPLNDNVVILQNTTDLFVGKEENIAINLFNGEHISVLGIIPSKNMQDGKTEEKIFETEILNPYNNKSQGDYIYVYTFKEGFCIIAAMPLEEVTIMRDVSIMLSTFMQVLIFAALFLLLYFLIKKIKKRKEL